MTRWAIIYNPVAGRFRPRHLEAVERVLRKRGVSPVAIPTRYAGHATEVARSLTGVDCVAVYGGDGSLNEVANGLRERPVPLAFLPGGTASVMAHELGLPRHPARAAARLHAGRVRPVRPGRIGSRLFLLMAGIGFDGAAVHGVRPGLKAWLGKGAYVVSALQALLRRQPRLRVSLNGHAPREAAWVVAARARHYAGGFVIHPAAGLTEDALGVAVVSAHGMVPFLVRNLGLGRPGTWPGIRLERAGAVEVSAAAPVRVQVDGDDFAQGTRFSVGLADLTLPLCFPAAGPPGGPPR